MTKKLLALDYHRNGVCGTGFYVALFLDDDGSRKVCTWFGSTDPEAEKDNCACAVLDLESVHGGDVSSAWRGDHYIDDMRVWALARQELEDWQERVAWSEGRISKAPV